MFAFAGAPFEAGPLALGPGDVASDERGEVANDGALCCARTSVPGPCWAWDTPGPRPNATTAVPTVMRPIKQTEFNKRLRTGPILEEPTSTTRCLREPTCSDAENWSQIDGSCGCAW
jgi:hypothetical protein